MKCIQEDWTNPSNNQRQQQQINTIQAKPTNYALARQGLLEGSETFAQTYAFTKGDAAARPSKNVTDQLFVANTFAYVCNG